MPSFFIVLTKSCKEIKRFVIFFLFDEVIDEKKLKEKKKNLNTNYFK